MTDLLWRVIARITEPVWDASEVVCMYARDRTDAGRREAKRLDRLAEFAAERAA